MSIKQTAKLIALLASVVVLGASSCKNARDVREQSVKAAYDTLMSALHSKDTNRFAACLWQPKMPYIGSSVTMFAWILDPRYDNHPLHIRVIENECVLYRADRNTSGYALNYTNVDGAWYVLGEPVGILSE